MNNLETYKKKLESKLENDGQPFLEMKLQIVSDSGKLKVYAKEHVEISYKELQTIQRTMRELKIPRVEHFVKDTHCVVIMEGK